MKRVIGVILLLALVLIFANSCNNKSNDVIDDTKSITDKKDLEEEKRNSAEIQYSYFEDLLEKTTDLIEGVFVSKTETKGVYYYEFTVIKNLRENDTEETIKVQLMPADYSIVNNDIQFSTYDVKYEPGKTYLLLLSRHSSVYTEGDVFSFVSDSLIIPLNKLTNTVSKQEILLYGTKLTEHLHSQGTISALNQGNFEGFILDKIRNNPLCDENSYIISTDVNHVIELSDYVLKVKIDNLYMESYTGDRITYTCTVEEVLKGTINKQSIKITFPINKVEIGNSYVVALSELEGTSCEFFVMSSKNSVYDCSYIESIRRIININ